jgi:isopentenyl-diphosphate Delta-isomerase
MEKELVVLVDEHDNEIGFAEKLEAHQKALLHRAFSVFIFNSNGELLLQQRAKSKYPRPNELVLDAAKRRLDEEMGLVLELEKKFDFIYKTPFDNDLTEHEFDHVFVGYTDNAPVINRDEVENYKWKSIEEIKTDLILFPNSFTSWFKIAIMKF